MSANDPKRTSQPELLSLRGEISCFLNLRAVGSGDLPVTIPLQLGLSTGVCVGVDSGSPIMDTDYKAPFPFTVRSKRLWWMSPAKPSMTRAQE
jgi:hypothetical protein